MSNPLIVVTGATGAVGSRIVKHLADAGHRVRALVRDHAKGASLNRSAEFVVADLLKSETLEAAFKGSDRAFFLAPPSADMELMAANALETARPESLPLRICQRDCGAVTSITVRTLAANWAAVKGFGR